MNIKKQFQKIYYWWKDISAKRRKKNRYDKDKAFKDCLNQIRKDNGDQPID
jgi:hypothetical protein